MKNKLMKVLSVLMCFMLSVSFTALPVSADLTEEQLAKAEEYIAANDRAGLYDYLRFEVFDTDVDSSDGITSADCKLEYLTHRFTGEYILDDDEAYQSVLKNYVYWNEEDGIQHPFGDPFYGDTNRDGKVSVLDVIALNKIAARITTATNPDHAELADVDDNYVIDFADVTILMQYLVDEIAVLPAMNY